MESKIPLIPLSHVAVCQVRIRKYVCGASLMRDHSGSTKTFHEHLLKKHNLVDPKSNKKLHKTQTNISKLLNNAKLIPKM
ncbi:hypothetical protein VP01_408g1 [Puccinia sorghi]|uniref:Uncharacterized protein n=1 Tax=Puccinia sorghi TaxID=27349 RepID=A0A0L6US81_9BASI|nr:hypothetical protein VP01_408g1 [Puccinia sorghi]